jgi:hypothetical protein
MSDMLGRYLSFRMTTTVIKKVKSLAGGIDQYLLQTPNEDLLYPKAIKLKRNLRSKYRLRARDDALAALEAAELDGAGAAVQAADAAPASSAPKFHIPGLWHEDHGGSIGFPGRKFGSTFRPDKWEERHTQGHASNR